jgi:hypothetical protein
MTVRVWLNRLAVSGALAVAAAVGAGWKWETLHL